MKISLLKIRILNINIHITHSLYKYALIINANIKERLGIINQELLIFRLTEDSKYKRKAFPRIIDILLRARMIGKAVT